MLYCVVILFVVGCLVFIYCFVGKDCIGFVVVLVFEVVGLDCDVIVVDYLCSNDFVL